MNKEIVLLSELLSSTTSYQTKIELKNQWHKNHIVPLKKTIVSLPIEEKKILGQKIKLLEQESESLLQEHSLLWQKSLYQPLNIDPSLFNDQYQSFQPHPLTKLLQSIWTWASELNFQIESGNEIVSTKENFDILNVPNNHPARNTSDTFYYPDKINLLRTHTTSHTAKMLKHIAPLFTNQQLTNYRLLSYGHVYRNDLDDPTHSHQFNQVDLLWVGVNLNIKHLKWLITNLIEYLFRQKIILRFRPSFFPFTSLSFEVDFKCIFCKSNNCSLCKNTGWIEVLGCGLLHPNVFAAANFPQKITAEKEYTGLAVGIGLERFSMISQQISDIRHFYQNDYRWLLKIK